MRIVQPRLVVNRSLRRDIERRTTLPLRPTTARILLDELSDEEQDRQEKSGSPARKRRTDIALLDPGWVFEESKGSGLARPLVKLAELAWWQSTSVSGSEALRRLWRRSVGVCLAARRLAKEIGDPDPDRVGRAGLLHGLGLWLVATVDPDWLSAWFELPDLEARRDLEVRDLGDEVDRIGRRLAERSGCDPLILDSIWLHADLEGGLNDASRSADRLSLIQQAHAMIERTPWGFQPSVLGDPKGSDPQLKLLIAEVQAKTGVDFIEPDASAREEALTRSNAKLRSELSDLTSGIASRDRLLIALGNSSPADTLDRWAEEAALALCEEPSVTTARVVWDDESLKSDDEGTSDRPPTSVKNFGQAGYPQAKAEVWSAAGQPLFGSDEALLDAAWSSWAALVGSQKDEESRLRQVIRTYRRRAATEETRLRDAKLAALAEFAAGAGHELNNPLAVIVGRAQLLLVHETDPKIAKSLRAILTQAQRAHRILRDLMYVARPPEPRPRFCQPDEIVRASLRDVRTDSEDREVRLSAVNLEHGARVWADPDGLRHLADTLVRNALEASPKGSQIRFSSVGDGKTLRWTIQDFGRGISANEGPHLFDPFFCGRQAGRGLGMGLPRAARFVAAVGGEIRWQSNPGQGTIFQVRLPLEEGPKPPTAEGGSTTEA